MVTPLGSVTTTFSLFTSSVSVIGYAHIPGTGSCALADVAAPAARQPARATVTKTRLTIGHLHVGIAPFVSQSLGADSSRPKIDADRGERGATLRTTARARRLAPHQPRNGASRMLTSLMAKRCRYQARPRGTCLAS